MVTGGTLGAYIGGCGQTINIHVFDKLFINPVEE